MSDCRNAHPGASFEWCLGVLFGSELPDSVGKHAYDLLAFCQRQQIAPLLYERSTPFLESSDTAWEISAGLEDAALEQWQRSNRIRFELNRVGSLFAGAGIDWVLLKGLGVSQRFYGSLTTRSYSDLDVLVHTADIGRATDCLLASDYDLRSARLDGLGVWRRILRRDLHHVELSRGPCDIEVHHCLRSHPAVGILESDLWSGLRKSEVTKGGCRVLSDENVLLTMLLALHADVELGVATLKNLVDVDAVLSAIDSKTDWSAFLAQRRSDQTLSIAVNGIVLTMRLLRGEERYPSVGGVLRAAPEFESLILAPVADTPMAEFLTIFDSAELGRAAKRRALVRNKIWAHRQYRGGIVVSLWNWASSLPIRLHGSGRPFQNLQLRRAPGNEKKGQADLQN